MHRIHCGRSTSSGSAASTPCRRRSTTPKRGNPWSATRTRRRRGAENGPRRRPAGSDDASSPTSTSGSSSSRSRAPTEQPLPALYRRLHRPATAVLSPPRRPTYPARRRQEMKRVLVLLGIAAVALATTLTVAQAGVDTNETVSYAYSGFVPCANGGAGEL